MLIKGLQWLSYLLIFFITPSWANVLQAIKASRAMNNTLMVQLELAQPILHPQTFLLDQPPRLIIDLSDTELGLEQRRHTFNLVPLNSYMALQTKKRTRVIFNLSEPVPHDIQTLGRHVLITFKSLKDLPQRVRKDGAFGLLAVDFRRNQQGAGLAIFRLSDPKVAIDVNKKGQAIEIRLLNSSLKPALQQRLDVRDFGTPVQCIDVQQNKFDTLMILHNESAFEYRLYQTDDTLTVAVYPKGSESLAAQQQERPTYTGERLSLNFQDIDVRAVLQLIADFTSYNLVASDSVQGKVTVRLENVPWDQALDSILYAKRLAVRQRGNIMMIAPSAEIVAREQQELQVNQQVAALAPLRSEFMQINYAKAQDIAALLKGDTNSLLSSRGHVSVDHRTNTLLVQDISEKQQEIRRIVRRLDTPVRQVEIEARIVSATKDFSRDLGVRWGTSADLTTSPRNSHLRVGVGRSLTDAQAWSNKMVHPSDRLNVNLGLANPTSQFAFSIAKLGSIPFLDLELSAAQAEDLTNVIASPKLITSNQREAVIKQGKQIPYLEASSSGATSVSFRDAVLELKVVPQITPDDHIIMDLTVTQDVVRTTSETVASDSLPIIDTKEIMTQVLVNNGETVVLGGVYEQTITKRNAKVPFLGDLPLLNVLFKKSGNGDTKNELLIFVTPIIVAQRLLPKVD